MAGARVSTPTGPPERRSPVALDIDSARVQPILCQRCGAAIGLPDDLAAVSATCSYCGYTSMLPQELVRARHARAAELRAQHEAAERARHLQERGAREARAEQRAWIGVALPIAGTVLIGIAIAGFSVWQAMKPKKPPGPAGEPEIATRMKELDALGCKHVVLQPKTQTQATGMTLTMPKGNCVKVLARSGSKDNPLTLVLKTPLGASVAPPAGTSLEVDHCAEQEGAHTVNVEPKTDDPFTTAAIECPLAVVKFKGKAPADADGHQHVSARLKTLDKAGCGRVFSAPKQAHRFSESTWTIAGSACYVVLAANGVEDTLRMKVTPPLGEDVAVPKPGAHLELRYCVERKGEYKVRIDAGTQEPFTVATIECPESVMKGLGGVVRTK
jgi:hypothetical protein